MRARLLQIDIEYTISFARPAFALLTQKFVVAEALATALGSLYSVNSGDVRVVDSNTLDDIEIKVDLFNRNGRFRFSADRLQIKFQNLRSKQDTEIVIQVLEAALKGIGPFLSNIVMEQEIINSGLTYEAVDGPESIKIYFAPLQSSAFLQQAQQLGFKFSQFTTKPKQTLALDISPSWSDEKMIFVSVNRFSEVELSEPIRKRLDAFKMVIESLLPNLGFEVVQSESWK